VAKFIVKGYYLGIFSTHLIGKGQKGISFVCRSIKGKIKFLTEFTLFSALRSKMGASPQRQAASPSRDKTLNSLQ